MIVMPSNGSHWWLHRQAGRAEILGRKMVGHLYSPGGQRGPFPHLPFALDNGAWGAFKNGRGWVEGEWRSLLNWACLSGSVPMWAAVPDAVGDAAQTCQMWMEYAVVVTRYGWSKAFVVQDGMTLRHVPPDADVVFVGGGTEWKRKTITYWCEHFPRVHVGRINTYRWLRYCADAGAESCDGTGFGQGDKKQLAGLMQFFREEEADVNRALGKNVHRRGAQS